MREVTRQVPHLRLVRSNPNPIRPQREAFLDTVEQLFKDDPNVEAEVFAEVQATTAGMRGRPQLMCV